MPTGREPQPTAFSIREATQDDAPLLHEFMVALVAERLPVLYERAAAPSVEEEREFIRSMSAAQGGVLFVAVRNNLIIGLLDFHRDKRPQAAHGGAFGMSVSREHRGKGAGRALLRALIGWAPAAGVSRLELQVFENNPGAIRLYQSVGFEHEGRRRQAVIVSGQSLDVLLMGLTLDPVGAPAG